MKIKVKASKKDEGKKATIKMKVKPGKRKAKIKNIA
jgi:hypothetical protein